MRETDHGLALRGGVIAGLKAIPAVAAALGERIYGGKAPDPVEWPFCRVEIQDAEGDEASGWIGEDRIFTTNFFVKPTQAKPDAEAEAFKILKAAKRGLASRITLELEPGEDDPVPTVLEVSVRTSSVASDRDEPTGYHARIEWSAKTVEEA